MSETTINKTIFVAASRETVWAYLTDKDKLGIWFHPAESDLAEGQDYALIEKADDGSTTRICWGTVTQMNKPSTLTYTFTVKPLNSAMTTVYWTLDEAAGGTRVTLRHEGIADAAGQAALGLLMALDGGWDKHLASLRKAVA